MKKIILKQTGRYNYNQANQAPRRKLFFKSGIFSKYGLLIGIILNNLDIDLKIKL